MSNQENWPSAEESTGTTTGPVEQLFDHFRSLHTDGTMTIDQVHNAKLIWYLASMAMYNTLTDAIRRPHLLPLITSTIKADIDSFLASNPEPALPGELTKTNRH